MAGDRFVCREITSRLIEGNIEMKTLYIDLFQRAMYRVGSLWETNKISVSTEHLATATIETLLNLAYPRLFSIPRIGKAAVVACVANEYHQLGGKMVADIMELQGWDCYFLGANTPVDGLIELIEEKKPALLGLSLAIYSRVLVLQQTITAIREAYSELPIVVGGQAFSWGDSRFLSEFNKVKYMANVNDLLTHLNQVGSN